MSNQAMQNTITNLISCCALVLSAIAIYISLNGSVPFLAPSVSDREIVSIQVKEIARHVRDLRGMQPNYPNGDIDILPDSAKNAFIGFIPYVAPISSAHKSANRNHRLAMSELTLVDNGKRIVSNIAGPVLVIGHGTGFTVRLPECPSEVCSTKEFDF